MPLAAPKSNYHQQMPLILPSSVSVSEKFRNKFVYERYGPLRDVEAKYVELLIDQINKSYGTEGKLGAVTPSPKNAVTINPTDPKELIISVDGKQTKRRDDCLQVFWVSASRLCIIIHIVNACLKYPVGSPQDKAYLATVDPTYFSTVRFPNKIQLPAVPEDSTYQLKKEASDLSASLFFAAGEDIPDNYRPAITAEMYYDFADNHLKRDDASSVFSHSHVRIQEALSFGEDLDKALAVLSSFNLKDTFDHSQMILALQKANLSGISPAAAIVAHMANLAYVALDVGYPEEVAKAIPKQLFPKVYVTKSHDSIKRDNAAFFEYSTSIAPAGLRLLNEFSTLAVAKLMAHPRLQPFVITQAYRNTDLAVVRDTLAWATGIDRSTLDELQVATLLAQYEAVVGVPPNIQSRTVFAPNNATEVRTRMSHPGRDYVHLVMQRLLCLFIDNEELTQGQIHARLFGDTAKPLDSINRYAQVRNTIRVADKGIHQRLLLTHQPDMLGTLPTVADVVEPAGGQVKITLPFFDTGSVPLGHIVAPWPANKAPPPKGATIPVLVWYNKLKEAYEARWYYA